MLGKILDVCAREADHRQVILFPLLSLVSDKVENLLLSMTFKMRLAFATNVWTAFEGRRSLLAKATPQCKGHGHRITTESAHIFITDSSSRVSITDKRIWTPLRLRKRPEMTQRKKKMKEKMPDGLARKAVVVAFFLFLGSLPVPND